MTLTFPTHSLLPAAMLCLIAVTSLAKAASAPERPPIVGVANIAVKSESLDVARHFYSGVLGLDEAFTTKDTPNGAAMSCFKVNDHQYMEVLPELKTETEDRLIRIGFETKDAQKLRDYLASKGVTVPAKVVKDPNGNLSFIVKDPDGHSVQFVQYMPGSLHSKNFGKHLSDKRISDHMLHVGMLVKDPARADTFYKEILGFRPLWKGGMTDTKTEWISLLVPDGHDWVEYMVSDTQPTPQRLGVLNHACLSAKDHDAIVHAHETVVSRGYTPPKPPSIGRDGRWLLHLYDKNYTRTELMVRKPAETPCCSPVTDDNI